MSTELFTDRLWLQPCASEDANALYAIYANDEVAYFVRPGPTTRAEIARELANPRPWSLRPRWTIVLDGHVVGEVILEIDQANLTANLGYAIARQHWGKGFATEAARAVVDYGFRACGLAKIYARADPRNVGSVRVMEKLGMQREGLLRSHVIRRGERVDRVYYGILRQEWEAGYASHRAGGSSIQD